MPKKRPLLLIAAITGILFLLPVAFAPYGADNGLFHLAGRMIVEEGAVHYRDIVDIKPPLIYYLYGAISTVTGSEPIGVRIFDFLLHGLVALLIYHLVATRSGRTRSGLLAAIIYALLYGGQAFLNMTQTESFLAPITVGLLLLLTRQKISRSLWLMSGLLCGIGFQLKFTFLGLLVLPLAAIYFYRSTAGSTVPTAMVLLGAMLGIGLLPLYLLLTGSTNDFLLMLEFTRGYAATDINGLFGTLVDRGIGVARWYLLYASPLLSALLLYVAYARNTSDRSAPLVRLCLVGMAAMTVTIAIEGNFAGWYFSRLFPFIAISAAVAADRLLEYRRSLRLRGPVFALLITVALLLSPLPRHLYHAGGVSAYLVDGYAGVDRYYGYGEGKGRLAHLEQAGLYARQMLGDSGSMYVASGSASITLLAADRLPINPVFHSGFYIAPFAPDDWRTGLRRAILADPPEILVLDDDVMETVTGVPTSSSEAFGQLPGIDSLITHHYELQMSANGIELYVRGLGHGNSIDDHHQVRAPAHHPRSPAPAHR